MIKRFIFSSFISMMMIACSASAGNKTEANKTSVYNWGAGVVEKLAGIYPNSFQEILLNPSTTDSDGQIPFTKADLVFLRNAGITSSIAQACGLDWAEKNYLPIMQWQRTLVTQVERNGPQIAMIGALHGGYQGQTDNWLKSNSANCIEANIILNGNLFSDKFKF